MSYIVSARKYRPQRFEDVVGQEHITSTLKNALLTDKLAHAFLFCGPRGVGKTTCARLLAKVINMPDPKAAVQDGSYAETDIDISMNIVELDAASNNSVEHMRTLIEQVRFQPQQGKYKVFIIDEVHMLSTAAFNAFLKTLEEPPPYAIFILATTEKHKILPTIMSRCQLYDFRRIQVPDIIQQLESIAQQEGVTAEHDALYTIAEKADGAMRDALSIYDRISSATDREISYKSVVDNLNLLDYDYFFRAVDLIVKEDGPGLLLLLEEILANGFEGDTFMNGLAKHLRNLMYCKQEPTLHLLQLSDALKEKFLNQSQTISYGTILTTLSLANRGDIDYPRAKDKRLHIEITLLKICYANRAHTIADGTPPASEKKKLTNPTAPAATPRTAQPPASPAPAPSTPRATTPPDIAPPPAVTPSPAATTPSPPAQDPTPAVPKATPTPRAKSKISGPSISSIDDLLSQAKEEVNSKANEAKELTLEELLTIWNEYAESISSPTTQAIVKNIQLKIVENKVVGAVPSSIAKEEIQQETDLYTKIRDYFNQNDLMIEIEVDRELFPDAIEEPTRKLYTSKEKYDHLVTVNPDLDAFIDTLDLKPDQD